LQPDDPIEDDSEESKILSFSGNEVATRQVDLQDEEIKPSEEKKKKGLESQTSPALKGSKVVAEEEAKVTAATDGVIGPGRTTVRNLKGDGDVDGGCWHILLYSRMRRWNGDVKKILGSIDTKAKSCQAKVATHLIKKEPASKQLAQQTLWLRR
jgi:hypothetical protein